VRVTHPFHPLSGQQLFCVGERFNRYGKRFLLRVNEGAICSVPEQWTDRTPLNPEVVVGEGRALFRLVDLIELERLVGRLSVGRHRKKRKGNCAAYVNKLTPQNR
jgi:Family of unknown function (DUF5372)